MPAEPGPPVRRRQQRGEERRQAIVEATLRIIQADGLEGVTHRRVADEAEVPLAATTYYFSSKEDLMRAAMECLIASEAGRLQVIADAVAGADITLAEGVEAVIAWQLGLLREQPLAQFAEFELFLRVARTAPPGAGVPAWAAGFREVARGALEALGAEDPVQDAHALVALVHGLVLHALTSGDPDFPENVLAPVLRDWFQVKFGSRVDG